MVGFQLYEPARLPTLTRRCGGGASRRRTCGRPTETTSGAVDTATTTTTRRLPNDVVAHRGWAMAQQPPQDLQAAQHLRVDTPRAAHDLLEIRHQLVAAAPQCPAEATAHEPLPTCTSALEARVLEELHAHSGHDGLGDVAHLQQKRQDVGSLPRIHRPRRRYGAITN